MLVPLWFVLCGLGLTFGNATALAMVPHGGVAGSASALLGTSQFLLGAAVPPLLSIGGTTGLAMGLAMGVAGRSRPRRQPGPRRADARGLDSRRCPSRGRVRTPGESSRLALLEATLRLAGERGYVGTTMARITKATGLPASSVYWHFGSKDQLLADAVAHGFEAWRSQAAPWETVDASLSRPTGCEPSSRPSC